MRDSLSLMLGLLGFRVVPFETAEAFFNTCREEWTGCIVADLRLPGMSGLQMQAALRAKGKQLPFIIITGHGDVKSARAAFQSEAVDFIEKPFVEAELRAAIEKALDAELQRIQRARRRPGSGCEAGQANAARTRGHCNWLAGGFTPRKSRSLSISARVPWKCTRRIS